MVNLCYNRDMSMKTKSNYRQSVLLGMIISIAFLFFSLPVNAYYTTNQEETLLDTDTILFTIEYQFGMKKHDLIMPVLAKHTDTKETTSLSYSIVDEDGAPAKGTATGIVFSSAGITRDGMYKVKKGVANNFALQVLFTPESIDTQKKYRLQVTNLPFNFDGKQQQQLNPSELVYYTTELKGF